MRTIILLLDWDSTLFWRDAEGGGRIEESTLPISEELKLQLLDYYKHYSELEFQDDSGNKSSELDRRLLDDRGLEIWQLLRKELKCTYRVLFHSAEFQEDFETREEFMATRKVTKP